MHEPLALQRRTFALPDRVRHLAFSPDGAALAAATHTEIVTIDLTTGTTRTTRGARQGLVWTNRGLLALSATRVIRIGKHTRAPATIAAAILDHGTTTLFTDTGAPAGTLPDAWRATVRHPTVALGTRDHLAVYDTTTREQLALHPFTPSQVVLSPDGARLLATSHAGAYEGPIAGPLTWYPESGELAHGGAHFAIGRALYTRGDPTPRRIHVQDVSALAFSPDGAHLAIGSMSAVQLVSLAAIAATPRPVGPVGPISALATDPHHDRVAAIDSTGLVCVWRSTDRHLLAAFHVVGGDHPIAFAPDGALLIGTAGLEIWDPTTATRRAARRIPGLDDIKGLAVAAATIAVRGHTRVTLLNLDGSVRHALWPDEDRQRISAIALSPDGQTLGVAREQLPSVLVDTTTGQIIIKDRELPPASVIVLGEHFLAYTRDSAGTLITDESSEETLPFTDAHALGDAYLWKYGDRVGLRARKDIRLDVRYSNTIHAISPAVDPARFLTAGDRWLGERSLVDGTLRRVLAAGAASKITALAFDPSGQRLAVGETSGRLHVWQLGPTPTRIAFLDGTTLQPAGTIRQPGHLGEISAIAFTAAELTAAAGELLTWDLAHLPTLATAVDRVVPVRATHLARDASRTFHGGDWGNDYFVHDAAGREISKGPGVDGRDRFTDLADDGRRVLLGATNEGASELSVFRDTGELLGTLRVAARVRCARFDAHGRILGVVDDGGPWFRWDPAAADLTRWISAPSFEHDAVDIVARAVGRVALHHSGGLTVLDETTGATIATIGTPGPHAPTCVAFSPDARHLAVGDWNGEVRLHALGDPGDRPDRVHCLAALSGTTDGGSWSLGQAGIFHHTDSDAMTRDWEAA